MNSNGVKGRTLWIFGIGLNAAILAKVTTYINSLLLTIGLILIIAGLRLEMKKNSDESSQ